MSRMSELDFKIKTIFRNTIIAFIVIVIALFVYAEDYRAESQKENRIKALEQRITKQEYYMHQVQADIDNLYRRIDNDK